MLRGAFLFPILLTCGLLSPVRGEEPSQAAIRLSVDAGGHHLLREDGSVFFYLGDTAWELLHRLNRKDTERYLARRAEQGFNVVHTVILSEFNGLAEPIPEGQRPLIEDDPARPNDAYFTHVDWVVQRAESHGMLVGLLPTWGDKWSKKWGQGPEIFTPENAFIYGRFLGRRYKDRSVIWILGGDRSPESPTHFQIIRQMAAGLSEGDGGAHLITYHPMGGADSSQWFHGDDWLSFNLFQSGHAAANLANDRFTRADFARVPPKPTIDGEPRYEDHPIDWKPQNGYFDEYDARQAAYWSVLAGACGHVYGNHNVWQFLSPAHPPVSAARTEWTKAIDQPGAQQMGYLRRLAQSRPFERLVPIAPQTSGDAPAEHRVLSAVADDGSYLYAYSASGDPVAVELGRLKGAALRASWFDPRSGAMSPIGDVAPAERREFTPPSQGRGNDWLLIVDDVEKNYPLWQSPAAFR